MSISPCRRAVAPGKNCVPAPLQLAAREIFADFSERMRARDMAHAPSNSTRHAIDARGRCSRRRSAACDSSAVYACPARPRSAPRRRSRPPSSACSRVSTSGGEKRIAFLPAPSTSSPRGSRVDDRVALRRSRAPSSARSRTSSTPIISPRPRTSPMSGCLSVSAFEPGHQVRADVGGVRHQRLLQQLDRRQRRGARHRVAAERARVRARRPRHQVGARRGDAERQARRDALRDRDDVGLDAGVLDREHLARCGPCPTALRRRRAGCRAASVSSRSRWRNCVGRDDVAALALNRLDDDRGDFVGRDEVHEQLVLDEVEALGRAALGRRARPDSDSSRRTARDTRPASAARSRGAASPCSPSATAIPCVRP